MTEATCRDLVNYRGADSLVTKLNEQDHLKVIDTARVHSVFEQKMHAIGLQVGVNTGEKLNELITES